VTIQLSERRPDLSTIAGDRDLIVLDAKDRRRLTQRLNAYLADLADTQRQLRREIAAALVGRRGIGTDESEDPEGSSLAFEQAQANSLLEQSKRHGVEIQRAISRVENGSYGACETCLQPITGARLEARPFTAHCIRCAS